MASTREVRPSSRISKPSKCCPIVVRKSATHATRASSPGTALASSYLSRSHLLGTRPNMLIMYVCLL
ncbi:hypothetical protein ACOSQ4_009904 [Xanthoceras sorbifolium]